MNRVLLVAYYFPPQPKAGALRPAYLAQHLHEFGWEPTVLTVDYPGESGVACRIIGVPGKERPPAAAPANVIRAPRARSALEERLRAIARSIVYFPDEHAAWRRRARTAGLRLTAQERFHAVLSTLPPPSAHVVGRSIAVRRGLPWLADYRDLWAGPAGPYFDREFGPIRRAVTYAYERRMLRRADALTSPTEGHTRGLREYFGRPDAQTIPNASDASIWDSIDAPTPKEFALCYAGKLYPRLRTPDVVFDAVARLRAANDPAGSAVRFDFYGEDPTMVAQSAARFGLLDAVRIHGEVPRRAALTAQRASAVLLLLLNTAGDVDTIEIANPGSKILEYAGARRPILAVGSPNNAMEQTMRETGLGMFAFDAASCADAIRALYARFASGKIEPDRSGTWKPFTPRDLAGAFAAVLDRISAGR